MAEKKLDIIRESNYDQQDSLNYIVSTAWALIHGLETR